MPTRQPSPIVNQWTASYVHAYHCDANCPTVVSGGDNSGVGDGVVVLLFMVVIIMIVMMK